MRPIALCFTELPLTLIEKVEDIFSAVKLNYFYLGSIECFADIFQKWLYRRKVTVVVDRDGLGHPFVSLFSSIWCQVEFWGTKLDKREKINFDNTLIWIGAALKQYWKKRKFDFIQRKSSNSCWTPLLFKPNRIGQTVFEWGRKC